MTQLRNPHPGIILKEEFLTEIGLGQNALAEAIAVPGNRIHAIVNGTRGITADTDLRLCKFFQLSEGYFLRLQNAYDILEAKRDLNGALNKIKSYSPDTPRAPVHTPKRPASRKVAARKQTLPVSRPAAKKKPSGQQSIKVA